jgi:hypothetical protein
MAATVEIQAGYENISVPCPYCHAPNVYNRASDIGHCEPISNWHVVCASESCGASFDIIGDLVNPGHEMLLLDAYDFLREKRYIQAVLSATTAYELFFSHFLRVEFVYRASNRDTNPDRDSVDEMNVALKAVQTAIERHTFGPMRRVFLRAVLDAPRPMNLAAAVAYVQRISKSPADISRSDIDNVPDPNLRELLVQVFGTRIANLRNDIVHKTAYRPRLDETKAVVDDAYSTIFRLGHHFGLANDNYHLNETPDEP